MCIVILTFWQTFGNFWSYISVICLSKQRIHYWESKVIFILKNIGSTKWRSYKTFSVRLTSGVFLWNHSERFSDFLHGVRLLCNLKGDIVRWFEKNVILWVKSMYGMILIFWMTLQQCKVFKSTLLIILGKVRFFLAKTGFVKKLR